MKNPKESIGNKFGVPTDITLDLPHITLKGNRELYIENYKSLILYTQTEIIVGNKKNMLSVKGEKLKIDLVRADDITILGRILQIDFKM